MSDATKDKLDKPARTRVAPSPTGDPHVGTAYMALFNRALADISGGQFLLRIEDTDRSRYVADSERQIFESLDWLGIKVDEGPHKGGPFGPYRQSERLPLYTKAAGELLAAGKAYRCYCTEERLEALRKIQIAEKSKHQGYDRLCRSLTPEQIARNEAEGRKSVVRLKMPTEGEIAVRDRFRGVLTFPAPDLQDIVLLKSDGYPTYHLANIVDDHEMGITHVIRAEEWIPSLPLHHELYKAFGWEEPVFAHMPLLRNKDKSKISKRKNPTSLLWYRDAGFLPEAMLNFLSLMGFSMPGDREKYAYPELLKEFSLDRINLGGPIFNLEKLVWLNGEYMRSMTPESLASRLVEFIARFKGRENDFPDLAEDELPKDDYIRKFEVKRRQNLRTLGVHAGAITSAPREQLLRIMPLIVERLHTLTEAADYLPMFFNDRFSYTRDDFTSKKTSHDQARKALAELHKLLAAFDFRDSDALAALDMRSRMLAEELGMKVGEFFGPARVAITGAKVSPPLIESMLVLGREATLARLERALAAL